MAYSPPGVTVTELTSPSVSPLLASPSTVAVVGLSSGAIRRTDVLTLVGTTPVALPGLPAGATLVSTDSTVVVKDSYLTPSVIPAGYDTNTGYSTADFTLDTVASTLARVSTGGSGSGGASIIPDGETVYVTYDYLPADYFQAALYTDLATIEERYGPSLDDDGSVVSAVSFGALCAFENGARQIYVAPLFKLTTASNPDSPRLQPSASEAAQASTWQQTLYALRDIDDINLLVPIAGQSQPNMSDASLLSIFHEVQDHCAFQAGDQQYVMAVFGEDASTDSSKATKATIRAHGADLASRHGAKLAEQTVLINTAKFPRVAPTATGVTYIGGQFVAAGLAGLLAAAPVAQSATRSVISGPSGVADPRSKQDKLTDGGAGLVVLEDRNGVVVIRHALTLDTTSVARRQINVVRAKHFMIESVIDTLDSQVIGKTVPNGQGPVFVGAAVRGVLERLKTDGDLVDYSNIQARTLDGDPTIVEVRFDYKPSFALDYISIKFAVDLTAQTVTAV